MSIVKTCILSIIHSAMRKGIALLFMIIPIITSCATSNTAAGRSIAFTEGIIYGENYSFLVTAPKGWVLDTESGAKQGLQAVFYPKGATWKDADAVMYVNTAKRKEGETLDDFIQRDIGHFRQNGSVSVKAESADAMKTRDGKPAPVRLFSGGQWKNNEAVAYIQERTIFVMIVLSSRTRSDFRRSWDEFRALVRSYQFWTEDIQLER